MRGLDFSSWQSVLMTLIGIALFALISIGIRLLIMTEIQKRRERLNRQINERLRTLIAAYKVLGGSFTGDLSVNPQHLRDLRAPPATTEDGTPVPPVDIDTGSERGRRIRDAVEAALSDILLLGTEQQVRLAGRAAQELTAGNPIHTHELVVSLRDYIRKALDLEPIPVDLAVPVQGPTRPSGSGGGRGGGERSGSRGGSGGGGMGPGMGMGMGMGMGAAADNPDTPPR